MFNCFKTKEREPIQTNETYPKNGWVMEFVSTDGLPKVGYGVFESEYDAQQYCIDNSSSTRSFFYYQGNFKGPYTTGGTGYPTYVYPIATRHEPNNYWDPNPNSICFTQADAGDYCEEHSNENVQLQYSIQYWIPAGTYDYRIHGFVGNNNFFRDANKVAINRPEIVKPFQVYR